jgi:hypothetical protein
MRLAAVECGGSGGEHGSRRGGRAREPAWAERRVRDRAGGYGRQRDGAGKARREVALG